VRSDRPQATLALIENVRPQAVINLAALTNVDACERDPNGAYLLNVRPAENLVEGLRGRDGAFLIQMSTDQVYEAAGPSREDDVKLTNTYALTKYAGELAAKVMSGAVLRTNFFGPSNAPGRKSFSDWILESLRGAKPMTGFTDVIFTPLSMANALPLDRPRARAADRRRVQSWQPRPYVQSRLYIEMARVYGLPVDAVKRGLSTGAGLPAYRPKDMSMDLRAFRGGIRRDAAAAQG